MISCQKTTNPLLGEYNTPHQTPPFDQIKVEHYVPAFEEAIKRSRADVDAIVNNEEAPTFENTIVALDRNGALLARVSGAFYNVNAAETNDEMQAVAQQVSPMLADLSNDINLNEVLFARVKAVYDQKEQLSLNKEQTTLLEDTYQGFARSGANLQGKDRERYREISKRLSKLSLDFDEHVLKATNAFKKNVTEQDQLSGLPDFVIEAAALKAKEEGHEGWTFDLTFPSYLPFMKYADDRSLRKEMYLKYTSKA